MTFDMESSYLIDTVCLNDFKSWRV